MTAEFFVELYGEMFQTGDTALWDALERAGVRLLRRRVCEVPRISRMHGMRVARAARSSSTRNRDASEC